MSESPDNSDLAHGEGEPDPLEFMALAHDAFKEDWDAPGMEAYDDNEPVTTCDR
jgi:hypothetical protein